jgi:hypothetical protein
MQIYSILLNHTIYKQNKLKLAYLFLFVAEKKCLGDDFVTAGGICFMGVFTYSRKTI